MIKVIAAARRRPGMTHSEFLDYLQGTHAELTRANPLALSRYVQNHVTDGAFYAQDGAYPAFFHRDSVVELSFASMADLQSTFSHSYTRDVVAADGINFSDLPTALSVLTTPVVVQDPPAIGQGTKILHWLKFAQSDAEPGSRDRLALAHDEALQACPEMAEALHGLVWNLALPPKPQDGASKQEKGHFGGAVMPSYDAVACVWMGDDDDDVSIFRRYEQALMATGLFERSVCFFVQADEVEILNQSIGTGASRS